MPTADRPTFAAQSVRYFLAQSYRERELVIVERGSSALRHQLPADPAIRHVTVGGHPTIGALRNVACQLARGEVIAHWDDDDWHGPDRLARQIAPLRGDADITALRNVPVLDLATSRFWTCGADLHRRMFRQDVHGGTLVYRRSVWERIAQYPDLSLAEDADFLATAVRRGARLHAIDAGRLYVYVRHATNAWPFPCGVFLDPAGWRPSADPGLPEPARAFYRAHGRAAPARAWRASQPLVSCIMPTRDRPELALRAITYFHRQTYPARELVIVDDGEHPIGDLVPAHPAITYHRQAEPLVLGAKRNLACELAHGDLLAHWDDDDWFAPDRLRVQVQAICGQEADLCGAGALYFYEPATRRAWRYHPPAPVRSRWVAGASLCYTREAWTRAPFAHVAAGEDTLFVLSGNWRIADVRDADCIVALVHGRNTSTRTFTGTCWRQVAADAVERLLGEDRDP